MTESNDAAQAVTNRDISTPMFEIRRLKENKEFTDGSTSPKTIGMLGKHFLRQTLIPRSSSPSWIPTVQSRLLQRKSNSVSPYERNAEYIEDDIFGKAIMHRGLKPCPDMFRL